MRKRVTATLQVKVVINMDAAADAAEILDELDYHFEDTTGNAVVVHTEIEDHEINSEEQE